MISLTNSEIKWGTVVNFKAKSMFNNRLANNLPFLPRSNKQNDRYSEFLLDGPQPADKSINPKNLFDDSNSEDRKWLKIARQYLNKLT